MKPAARTAGQNTPTVLIVDDESDILELLELTLLRMGLESKRAMKVSTAVELLKTNHYDLCLTDMRLPDGTGLELVQHIGQLYPTLPVAVITAYGSTDNAVAALKAGAFDYIAKPVSLDQLRALVKSALNVTETPAQEQSQHVLLGDSPAIQLARDMIEKLARSQAPVYVTGESGCGKELAARLIHEKSTRQAQSFMPVNCGAIPENLMESEFFGYKKGAFTGADADRDGFFQAAHGGTLFLDEVADLPLALQAKVVRAIEYQEILPIGDSEPQKVGCRIIASTTRELSREVAQERFHEDLFYRLDGVKIRIPPLRERSDDIPELVEFFLTKYSKQMKKRVFGASSETVRLLTAAHRPVNR